MSFSYDITKFCEKTKVSGATVMKKLAFDIFAAVLMKSPVDTGRFRANWRITMNRIILDDHPAPSKAPQKQSSISSPEEAYANFSLGAFKWTDTIVISNNLPYAGRLERGWSKQAPAGVLRISINEATVGFERIVNRLS